MPAQDYISLPMRYPIIALAFLLSFASSEASELFRKFVCRPECQFVSVINLRNPQLRQALDAKLAENPGASETVNRFAASITHIAAVSVVINGKRADFLFFLGNFDDATRQTLLAEGSPPELMDSGAVCVFVKIDGVKVTAAQFKAMAQSRQQKK